MNTNNQADRFAERNDDDLPGRPLIEVLGIVPASDVEAESLTTDRTDHPDRYELGEATASDRIILPEQAALVFDVRDPVDDENGGMVVDVKVVFADGTSHNVVPPASNIAARAAHVVALMLRGQLDVVLPTDPMVHPDLVAEH